MLHPSVFVAQTGWHLAEFRFPGSQKFDGTESHMQGTCIESEITRYHGARTRAEVIEFMMKVCSQLLLLHWLRFDDDDCSESIGKVVTRGTLAMAVPYEVMFVKMLRRVPRSERKRMVSEKRLLGMTVLHRAAESGSLHTVKVILALYSEAPTQLLEVMSMKTIDGKTLLHYAVGSGNVEMIKFLLGLIPELSQRMKALNMRDDDGHTVLDCAVESAHFESVKSILSLYPE